MGDERRQLLRWLLVSVCIALGVGLRAVRIDDQPLWVDEAESSINGLTIISEGLPVDHYLGMPIFENVLLQTWPESEEYEFKDLSYSDQGLAIYHGWLPLYSIALAEWCFGVTPDLPQPTPHIAHDLDTIQRRTWVPRVPSLIYSALFLSLLYITGRSMAGEAAGWAALVFAGVGEKFIWFGYQARYYSATLCMDALCAWALWRCCQRGKTRDFVLLGVASVMLFHTHVMSCAAFLITTAVVVPIFRRHSGWFSNSCVAATIFLVGSLPWAWYTGFLRHTNRLPPARDLLIWPDDALEFIMQRTDAGMLLIASLLGMAMVVALNRRHAWFAKEEITRYQQACLIGLVWLCVAYALFLFLMPAASFYWVRMTMTLETPALLLLATGLSIVAQAWTRTYATIVTVAITLVFVVTTDRFTKLGLTDEEAAFEPIGQVLGELADQSWSPDTKFYGSPNFHLVFSYYLGVPVQSIAPIRQSYLDNYPGEIVLIIPYLMLTAPELETSIRETAEAAGYSVDGEKQRQWKRLINQRTYYDRMVSRVASISPTPMVPQFLQPALKSAHALLEADESPMWVHSECPVMMRGFVVTTYEQWWVHYFYRFVDPRSRLETLANFAGRLLTSHMKLLPRGYSVCYIPSLSPRTASAPKPDSNTTLDDASQMPPKK